MNDDIKDINERQPLADRLKVALNESIDSLHNFWRNKRVLVLGPGFLGSHVIKQLETYSCYVSAFHKNKYDLTDREQTRAAFKTYDPDIIINCAGVQGGIKFQRENQADVLYKNASIALNVYDQARKLGVEKLISIIPSCAYPDSTNILEKSLFDGQPHSSVYGHAHSKRLLQALTQAYHVQHGFNSCCVALTNLYGPGANFGENSKVVEATIDKIIKAKNNNENQVHFWGDGSPLRQFLFVEDAAKYLIKCAEVYNEIDYPINIAPPEEVSIKDLVELVSKLCDYNGEIIWSGNETGQQSKKLDTTKLNDLFSSTFTPLEGGLKKTIEWYKKVK